MSTYDEEIQWRTPEELVEIGFSRSRVVMMNEAHGGLTRCLRTREIGRRTLQVAHHAGVRHLAMEALWSRPFVAEAQRTRRLPPHDEGYLAQPEMRAFVQDALDLGWTLVPYEADLARQPTGVPEMDADNWRKEEQARNLIAALHALLPAAPLLVWCGNGHHTTVPVDDWLPTGYRFTQLSGLAPFTIDQTVTVFSTITQDMWDRYTPTLAAYGGTAGFLLQEGPRCFASWVGVDALILSTENALE